MEKYVFKSQYLAFSDFTRFGVQFTVVQEHLAKGGILDQNFDFSYLNGHLNDYFGSDEIDAIQAETTIDNPITVSGPSLTTELGSGYQAAIKLGAEEGKEAASLIRMALGIASNASIPELKYATGRVPNGISGKKFPLLPSSKREGFTMAMKLAEFLDPETLLEALATSTNTNKHGYMNSYKAVSSILDAQQPISNLADDAAMAAGARQARQLGLDDALRRVKFKRLGSHLIASNKANAINAITRQFLQSKNFKLILKGNRFT